MIETDNLKIKKTIKKNELLDAEKNSTRFDENFLERALRPKNLQSYIGQSKIKQQLEIFIAAAKNRKEALDLSLIHI